MAEEETQDSAASEQATEQQVEQVAEEQSSLTENVVEHTSDSVIADIQQIESLTEMDPSMLEDPGYLALKDTLSKLESKDKKEADQEEAPVVDSEESSSKKEAPKKEEKDEEGEEKDEDDVFGLFGEKPKKIDINLNEDTLSHIKDKYSIEDADKFFNSVDTWRNQAQEGSEFKTKFTDIEEGLASLPNNIKAAISAYAEGDDYHAAFGSSESRLDYSGDFEKQDKEAVVQHYFGQKLDTLKEKLEGETIDEEDYAERYDELHELSERLFKNDKKGFQKQRADYIDKQDKIEESRTGSISSSVNSLKKEFPNFSQADLQRVQQRMVDGTIEEPFYEKDGSYKTGAAKMLAFAMYGERVIKSLLNKTSKDATSKANKKIVDRSDKQIRESSKGTEMPQSKEHKDAVSHLGSHFDEDPYA